MVRLATIKARKGSEDRVGIFQYRDLCNSGQEKNKEKRKGEIFIHAYLNRIKQELRVAGYNILLVGSPEFWQRGVAEWRSVSDPKAQALC